MPLYGKTILVAEDDYLIAADLFEAIESGRGKIGKHVTTVRGAHEVLSASTDFDGAVLDLKLLNGLATSVAERLHGAGVPFILLTGYHEEFVPAALQGVPYLAKPFRREDFLKIAASHFDKPRGRP